MAALVENLATAALTVVALSLFIVSLAAWRHTGGKKILFLALGFGLFFAKGIVLSLGLFLSGQWETQYLLPSLVLDLAALLLFYAAVLRRGGT